MLRSFSLVFLVVSSLICATALAVPVKTMMSARMASTASNGESSPNPYVSKGLVAMWDGEWNSGWGVHDDSATTWVDLIGNGYNATMVGGVFGDRCAKYTTNADNNPNLATFEKPLPVEVGWTVEITFKWLKTAAGGGYYGLFSPNPAKSVYFDLQAYARGAEYLTRGRKYNGFRLHEANVYNIITRHVVLTYNATTEDPWGNTVAKKCYVNGVELTNTGTGNFNTKDEQSSVACGIGCKDYYAPWAEFYRIAVYNRELTYEEVMHNYQIDKERFGVE